MGFAGVKGQAPGGAFMVARESLKALHLWDSVAHNNPMGEMATSHELPKQEERCTGTFSNLTWWKGKVW